MADVLYCSLKERFISLLASTARTIVREQMCLPDEELMWQVQCIIRTCLLLIIASLLDDKVPVFWQWLAAIIGYLVGRLRAHLTFRRLCKLHFSIVVVARMRLCGHQLHLLAVVDKVDHAELPTVSTASTDLHIKLLLTIDFLLFDYIVHRVLLTYQEFRRKVGRIVSYLGGLFRLAVHLAFRYRLNISYTLFVMALSYYGHPAQIVLLLLLLLN